MDTYLEVLKKYAVFSGRAPRKEYWMFFLFNFIIALVLGGSTGILAAVANIDLTFIAHLYSLGVLCPGIAVGIRRLHDIDKSGWWYLLLLIPLIGPIVILVFMCQPGSSGNNRFGSDPYAGR